jgi:hypothetical protein
MPDVPPATPEAYVDTIDGQAAARNAERLRPPLCGSSRHLQLYAGAAGSWTVTSGPRLTDAQPPTMRTLYLVVGAS